MKVGQSSSIGWRGFCRRTIATIGATALAGLGGGDVRAADFATDLSAPVDGVAEFHLADERTALEAVELYVNPVSGDDRTGDGSAARPFQTITQALELAQPGTIVRLAPGTYGAGEQFPIVLRPEVTLLGDPDRFGADIEIIGGGWLMTPTAGEQNAAILGFGGAGLSGVTVRNPSGSAIWVAGGTPWLVANTIAGNARHGIAAHDGTPYILNNRFEDNGGADIELSEGATPQLQGNQLDDRNPRSLAYLGVEIGIETSVETARVAEAGFDAGASPRPIAAREPEASDEVVPWQGESSFPPLVRPSVARSSNASADRPTPDRPTPTTALPIDPDLGDRANRANRAEARTESRAEAPIEVRAWASADRAATQIPARATEVPARPTGTPNRPLAARSDSPPTAIARRTPSDAPEPDVLSWGASVAGEADDAARDSLLRWEGLDGSDRTTQAPNLPPPIVDRERSRTQPPSRSIAALDRPAAPIEPVTHVAPAELPVDRVEPAELIEPLARTSLPLAYRPSNADPFWPEPSAHPIVGPVPLPVPDPYPPIGNSGQLPSPPLGTTNAGDPPPPPGISFSPLATRLRYRLLVSPSAGLDDVRAIAGDAIETEIDGNAAIQAGVFSDRWRAESLLAALQAAGLTAWIVDVD
ncbi:MAG: DUF1565 domain-containing protein [Geitlerinemataceae cyanobacterium]